MSLFRRTDRPTARRRFRPAVDVLPLRIAPVVAMPFGGVGMINPPCDPTRLPLMDTPSPYTGTTSATFARSQ